MNNLFQANFNAVDVTVLIRPNTQKSFFHLPTSPALDFLPKLTSDSDCGVFSTLTSILVL